MKALVSCWSRVSEHFVGPLGAFMVRGDNGKFVVFESVGDAANLPGHGRARLTEMLTRSS